MPELSHSHRRLYKATYAPVRPEKRQRPRAVLAKTAAITSLDVRPSELQTLQRHTEVVNSPALGELLDIVTELAATRRSSARPARAKQLADVTEETLLRFGELLVELRADEVAQLEATIEQLRAELAELAANTEDPDIRDEGSKLPGGGLSTPDGASSLPSLETTLRHGLAAAPERVASVVEATDELSPMRLTWSPSPRARALSHTLSRLVAAHHGARFFVDSFKEQMSVEPIGRLHLERLEMTPVGIQRGELVSSIPLAPKETVNLSHREWSVTTEEYESIIRDQFEGYSEKGVSEKTDVALSTQSQRQRATAMSVAAAASASYMGVTLSSSFGYNSTSNDSQAKKDSRNQSMESTRRASSRVRKDHKTSFRVSSVAGTEDRAVRMITNPSETESMRVDYYQLMRKWRVDLYRYGLRMTYDIVIPSPGADLMRKYRDLEALDARIAVPFTFDLTPGQLSRSNWQWFASQYQAEVNAPPPNMVKKITTLAVSHSVAEAESSQTHAGTIDLEIAEGYTLHALTVHTEGNTDPGEGFSEMIDINAPRSYHQGLSGLVQIPIRYRHVVAMNVVVEYVQALTYDAWSAWQFETWAAIRAAAEDRYVRERQQLEDVRAELAQELAPFDSLTLRRMELEEIEKGVLRWLFGPSFSLSPPDVAAILNKMAANDPLDNDALDPSSLTNQQWQRMLGFGEFIKYLHHAIEWENLLYFVYPYFWDHPNNWTLKQFLEHPDPIHRRFLRSGSARVVLTIRPGFETSFTELVENGAFETLPGDHPYVSIAQEIQSYAETNYPGIPPANPENPPTEEEIIAGERGVLQATWWEYTPTSALDIQLNTALSEMA